MKKINWTMVTGLAMVAIAVITSSLFSCGIARAGDGDLPVSYTHLTLPTIYSV